MVSRNLAVPGVPSVNYPLSLHVECSAPKLSNLPDLQKSSDVSDEGGVSINCS